MRRMLIPLAGLLLANVVGCHLVQGQCDCDNVPPLRPVGATHADLAPVPAPIAPAPLKAEPIREMPRVTPDKE
jgi:hypothetical protein